MATKDSRIKKVVSRMKRHATNCQPQPASLDRKLKPHIAINIANCVAGGGLQIALWFVDRLMRSPPTLFSVAYIINVKHLGRLPVTPDDTLVVQASPLRSLIARRQIKAFLRAQRVDCVLSLFGPSGIAHPKHICGVANAFITSLDSRTLREIHGWLWPLQFLRYLAFGRMLTRSRALIFETSGERDRFVRRWGYPTTSTTVIANSVHDVFLEANNIAETRADSKALVRFLFVTSAHVHKNNHMIPAYIAALKQAGMLKFVFTLTLTASEGAPLLTRLGEDASYIELIGKLTPNALLEQYRRCSVVVQHSSLETYSAVYNEVRFARRALLASDRPFAREICGDFAHFFEPLDADSFAISAKTLVASLSQAETASWIARQSVLLPEAKFQRIMDVVERVAAAPCSDGNAVFQP